MLRVGLGYDSHHFVPNRPLILGGQHLEFEFGLAGHSDADPVSHAVIDAVLGAAAAGDIGTHFPDTDPAWKDANSIDLLREVGDRLHRDGFTVRQVDVTVIAERPKLAEHKPAMAAAIAEALGLPVAVVSVKAKTNEGMGFIGRGEGIAVMAVAMVEGP